MHHLAKVGGVDAAPAKQFSLPFFGRCKSFGSRWVLFRIAGWMGGQTDHRQTNHSTKEPNNKATSTTMTMTTTPSPKTKKKTKTRGTKTTKATTPKAKAVKEEKKVTPKAKKGTKIKSPVAATKKGKDRVVPDVDDQPKRQTSGKDNNDNIIIINNDVPQEVSDSSDTKPKDPPQPDPSRGSTVIVPLTRGPFFSTDQQTNQPDVQTQQGADSKAAHSKEIGNGLTALIPGYVAPLKLDTSSTLDPMRLSISQMRRQAQRTDSSTRTALYSKPASGVTKQPASASTGNKAKKVQSIGAGAGWFHMQPSAVTDELKMDLAVIRNRNVLDPKRFYKSSDKFGSVLQVGTVVEGASEYYSSRLTKKERRNNLTEELLADSSASGYASQKYLQISQARQQQAAKRKWGGGKRKRRSGGSMNSGGKRR